MNKRSKVISGLRNGKIIIQKSYIYFTDPKKRHIIQELLSSGCSLEKIYRTG